MSGAAAHAPGPAPPAPSPAARARPPTWRLEPARGGTGARRTRPGPPRKLSAGVPGARACAAPRGRWRREGRQRRLVAEGGGAASRLCSQALRAEPRNPELARNPAPRTWATGGGWGAGRWMRGSGPARLGWGPPPPPGLGSAEGLGRRRRRRFPSKPAWARRRAGCWRAPGGKGRSRQGPLV